MKKENQNEECCPQFKPEPWDDKVFEWTNKPFVKDSVCTIYYMPLNFGAAIRRVDKKVSAAGGKMTDWMCLSHHTSKWNMDIFISVDKEIAGAHNMVLNGRFYSKVYEGDFKETGDWCKDYDALVKSKGFTVKKMYMWYTTCPKCAKKYGKNFVVIVSELSS